MPVSRRHGSQRRIVRALRRGDAGAVELVASAYGSLLRGYLSEMLGDPEAVQDVLQQTLMEVWRRGRSYDPDRAAVSTWLLVIARSRAIDHLRKRVPEPIDPDRLGGDLDSSHDDGAAALLERWRLAAMISALPRDEGRLLRLRFYEELSQREIAERTGIPLGTVKMLMVRGLGRLRAELDREERR